MKRLWLLLALAVVSCQSDGPTADSTVAVIKGDLLIGAEIEGELEAVNSVSLAFPNIRWIWDSKISFLAAEGEQVKKGDKLAVFDDKKLQKRLDEVTAQRDTVVTLIAKQKLEAKLQRHDNLLDIKTAEAALKKASLKAKQPSEDVASNLLRQLKIDEDIARAALANTKEKNRFQVLKARQSLQNQERNLERFQKIVTEITEDLKKLTLTAPDDGTLLYKKNWQEEKIKIGDRAWRGMAVVELVSVDKLKAKAHVAEIEISKVDVDQSVSFRVESHPDIEIKGQVTKVSENVRRKDPEKPLKVIDLELTVSAPPNIKLRPGMKLRGTSETHHLKDVLLIPLSAIGQKDGGFYVNTKSDQEKTTKQVTLGPQDKQWAQVTSGLNEGDVIFEKAEI